MLRVTSAGFQIDGGETDVVLCLATMASTRHPLFEPDTSLGKTFRLYLKGAPNTLMSH